MIVIGAGHAGIEASLACARLGCKALMVTFRREAIGLMSCNPAIGGVGKAQLVREIDALGGEMAKAADSCGIQFRILNASKGPAVQSLRAQVDKYKYLAYMRRVLRGQKDLTVKEAEVTGLIVKDGTAGGVVLNSKEEAYSSCVVIAAGTFLDGLVHIGLDHHSAGRIDEPASIKLTENLKGLGFDLLRFKTGTCARLDKNSIDFSRLIVQKGDDIPQAFSFSTKRLIYRQVPCYITYTNEKTHRIILDNLGRSPLYSGIIRSTGVRYCPSVEDKIVKFRDKARHQVFLEPEGLKTDEIYPNGLSTSLPADVQLKIIHSIEGLEKARVIRYGYGIEHAVIEPRQLYPTLEAKLVKNLYLAGQINGTTGYEEAAALGLIAGVNAALRIKKKEPFILDRASSYIGVLIDDLTTKGTPEPYRMFTSRVEYRLILRQDNADLRLRDLGCNLGLVGKKDHFKTEKKRSEIQKGTDFLKGQYIKPCVKVNQKLRQLGTSAIKNRVSLEEMLKRPQISLKSLLKLSGCSVKFSECALQQLEIEVKYSGFIQRQSKEVERFKNLERVRIPQHLDYAVVPGLSCEIREKLDSLKPLNLGQASRISGITPAAISILMVYLRRMDGQGKLLPGA